MRKTAALLVYSVLLCLASTKLLAQREPVYLDALMGDSIYTGNRLAVADSVFYDPLLKPGIKNSFLINNIISLRLNEGTMLALPDSFTVTVRIGVQYCVTETSCDSISEKLLTIDYHKNRDYRNKAILQFAGARYVEARILGISSSFADTSVIRKHLVLENLMAIERNYVVSCTNDAISTLMLDTLTVASHGEVRLSWTPNNVSQQYDVEWTFIDSSAIASGRYNKPDNSGIDTRLIFRNNATRITTKASSYQIPLLYDGEGFLFYRVRGTQQEANGEISATLWSSEKDTVMANWRYPFSGHHRNLNWQAVTSFAEGGLRKSVVQYFDGSLRARQVVTRDNTTTTTVVAETLYDEQGRPAIQVMPAPTLNTLIGFTPRFNTANAAGDEYDKTYYDGLTSTPGSCGQGADSMSALSGAALYYSPNNPLVNSLHHQFIPDAKGFAFTETEYAPDNSGRVTRQSGVGKEFRLGSGHETKYYYGQADQTELDALFGTEAGYASHYQKNIVKDANGQYSVSYVDMHGRTVATALSGSSPTSLQPLSSLRDSVQTEQLITPLGNLLNGQSIVSTSSFFLTKNDSVWLRYSLGKESLKLEDCRKDTICYDCLYDLSITVTGECADGALSAPYTYSLHNVPLYKVDTACGLAIPYDHTIRLFLTEGSYTVTKTLSISEYGMSFLRDSVFLPRNTCVTYQNMLDREKTAIRDSLDCDDETAAISTQQSQREMMLYDLYPLTGQYGDTAAIRSCFSIFNLQANRYGYQLVTDTAYYRNETGGRDSVLNGQGQLVLPQQLSPTEFIAAFKPSWAPTLLSLHPEYCLLKQYDRMAASAAWNDDFLGTETYAEAFAKGYLNPTGSNALPGGSFPIGQTDPLFGYAFATGAKQAIEDSLFHYRDMGANPDLTAWGLATSTAKCAEPVSQSCVNQWNSFSNAFNASLLCAGELDMAWRTFRSIYLENKQEWVDRFVRQQCAALPYPQAPCNPVFPNSDSLMASGGYGSDPLGDAQNAAAGFYAQNCNAYRQRWNEQLSGCYTEAERTVIINYLVEVCKRGADENHPYGASSIKTPGSYVFDNFAEAVQHVNDSLRLANGPSYISDVNCTAFLVDRPLPYGQPAFLANEQVWSKPDTCVCNRISGLYAGFQQSPAGAASFSSYVERELGTYIAQPTLDSLLALCNGTISCKFLVSPLTLPPALQCAVKNPCIDCDAMAEAYESYMTLFPGRKPSKQAPDSLQQSINTVFTNFMN
ncbi:MAG TPA: DUF6443 domain-containing protein, partial [Flavisolibacter sp.]|nr:DUF6443 domain-containing protein [Flavisolibacter sp.]